MSDEYPAIPTGTVHFPDAHGQAALLLVESLIHGLVARSDLSVAQAVEIVQRAIEVETDTNDYFGHPSDAESVAATLLSAIASSLLIDAPPKPDSQE